MMQQPEQLQLSASEEPTHKLRKGSFASCHSACSTDDQQAKEQRLLGGKALKYKTQLCRNFNERGWCPYEEKCQFAHGLKELQGTTAVSHRSRKCKSFWQKGFCPYGKRCKFGHYQHCQNEGALLLALYKTVVQNSKEHWTAPTESRLLRILKRPVGYECNPPNLY